MPRVMPREQFFLSFLSFSFLKICFEVPTMPLSTKRSPRARSPRKRSSAPRRRSASPRRSRCNVKRSVSSRTKSSVKSRTTTSRSRTRTAVLCTVSSRKKAQCVKGRVSRTALKGKRTVDVKKVTTALKRKPSRRKRCDDSSSDDDTECSSYDSSCSESDSECSTSSSEDECVRYVPVPVPVTPSEPKGKIKGGHKPSAGVEKDLRDERKKLQACPVDKSGDCLFEAVRKGMYGLGLLVPSVDRMREDVYLVLERKQRAGEIRSDINISEVKLPKKWNGDFGDSVPSALAELYKLSFVIYQANDVITYVGDATKPAIKLLYHSSGKPVPKPDWWSIMDSKTSLTSLDHYSLLWDVGEKCPSPLRSAPTPKSATTTLIDPVPIVMPPKADSAYNTFVPEPLQKDTELFKGIVETLGVTSPEDVWANVKTLDQWTLANASYITSSISAFNKSPAQPGVTMTPHRKELLSPQGQNYGTDARPIYPPHRPDLQSYLDLNIKHHIATLFVKDTPRGSGVFKDATGQTVSLKSYVLLLGSFDRLTNLFKDAMHFREDVMCIRYWIDNKTMLPNRPEYSTQIQEEYQIDTNKPDVIDLESRGDEVTWKIPVKWNRKNPYTDAAAKEASKKYAAQKFFKASGGPGYENLFQIMTVNGSDASRLCLVELWNTSADDPVPIEQKVVEELKGLLPE